MQQLCYNYCQFANCFFEPFNSFNCDIKILVSQKKKCLKKNGKGRRDGSGTGRHWSVVVVVQKPGVHDVHARGTGKQQVEEVPLEI